MLTNRYSPSLAAAKPQRKARIASREKLFRGRFCQNTSAAVFKSDLAEQKTSTLRHF